MVNINIKQIQAIENEMLRETIAILNARGIDYYMCCGSVLGVIRHGGPIPWDTDMDILIPANRLAEARDALAEGLSERFCIDDLSVNPGYKNLFPRVAMPHTSSDTLHIDLFPLMGLPNDEREQVNICKKLARRQKTFIRYKHYRQKISHPTPLKNFVGRLIEIFCSPFSKKELTRQYYKIVHKYHYDDSEYVMNACGHYGAKNIFNKDVFGKPEWRPYLDIEAPIPEKWDFYLRRYYKEYMNLPPEEERNFWLSFTLPIDERDYDAVKDIIENEQK